MSRCKGPNVLRRCTCLQVYALVGVAAMLAANCRVPLTSVLLLFELTRGGRLDTPWTSFPLIRWSRSCIDTQHPPDTLSRTADYYIIVPALLSVGLSFWAVQYALRAISIVASYTPDFRAGQ